MVQFETNKEKVGKASNSNNKETNSNKFKRTYPTTPHPVAKKKRSGNNAQDGNLAALENNVESPHGNSPSGMPEQDTADEEDEEDFNFDSEWKSFTHSETPETNLKSFLLTQSSRKMATENFSLSLDECLNGLNEAIHDILNDSVVPIHNETLVRFEACDADIVATMKSNHNRRAALTKCMEDANAKWTKQYQRLRQKIGQMNGRMNDVGEGEEEGSDTNSPNNSNSNITLQGDDLDWDELGDSECNREKIRCFLHAREQFQSAEESLSQNLDDIHEGLKAQVEAIIQAAVDIHEQHHTTCMALEDDIQYHLMENSKRRACLQEKLEESAKQAQGLFANLLSRLSQKL